MEDNKVLVNRVQEFFKQKGVEVSDEDAESFVKFIELGKENKLETNDQMVYNYLSGTGDELSDKDLEAVAGGQSIFGWIVDVVSTPFRAIGTALGAALCGVATPFRMMYDGIKGNNVGTGLKNLWGGLIDYMWDGFGVER